MSPPCASSGASWYACRPGVDSRAGDKIKTQALRQRGLGDEIPEEQSLFGTGVPNKATSPPPRQTPGGDEVSDSRRDIDPTTPDFGRSRHLVRHRPHAMRCGAAQLSLARRRLPSQPAGAAFARALVGRWGVWKWGECGRRCFGVMRVASCCGRCPLAGAPLGSVCGPLACAPAGLPCRLQTPRRTMPAWRQRQAAIQRELGARATRTAAGRFLC